MGDDFYLPRNDEHVAIVGQNGSGKTQAGAWLLSRKNLRDETWIILDYKEEEIFQKLQNVRDIGFTDKIPRDPGLYVLHARYGDDDDATEAWLHDVYDASNTGVFVDEGYMLPQYHKGAYAGILTQGRSRRIPTITLTQRPVRVNPLVFSESKHIVVFDLNRKRDMQTIEENTGDGFMTWTPPEYPEGLPEFHARWYASRLARKTPSGGRFVLKPVPREAEIIAAIDKQLPQKRRWL